ncbi:MAG: pectate lyase superfamily protein [Polaromonas sp.]|nr:pectate lyase superfamily protein [Polaromonas sp.]
MAGVIASLPKFQFSAANGAPLVGGTLTVCVAGTTTPMPTWQDSAMGIANTNPITLDARGECLIWLDPGSVYKFILKNAAGVVQWTVDGITNAAALAHALRAELTGPGGAAMLGGAVQMVASLTALRSLLKASASKNAFVSGYYAAGDGGGGSYYLDAADSASLDNGGTVIVGTDGGRWKFAGSVHAGTFGAVGDYNGTTGRDNTAALQAAIDAGASRLPKGRYKITAPLTMRAGMCLHGDDEYNTVIEQTGACPIFVNDPAAVPDFARTNLSRITLRGGTLAHKYTLTGTNVQSLGDWSRVRFENQTVRGIDCDRYFIANNFYNCVWFYCTSGIQCGMFANLNNFVNCRFEGMAQNTIVFLDGAPPGSPGTGRGGEVNVFTGCRFEARKTPLTDTGFTLAILKTCTNTVFDGCYIEDTWQTILVEEGAGPYGTTVFRNCKFSGQEVSVLPAGPKSERFYSDGVVTFDNNYFEFGTTNTGTARLHLVGSNAGLNTSNAQVLLAAPSVDGGQVLAKPWAPASGTTKTLLSVTRADLTNAAANAGVVSGRVRLAVTGADAAGVPFSFNRAYPFVITGFSNAAMTAVLGTPTTAESNAPGAVLTLAASGASAGGISLGATVTLAGMLACQARAEIDWCLAFNSGYARPVVSIL